MAEFGETPTSPPPSSKGSWLFIDGRWIELATDSGDGVPDSFDDMPKKPDNPPKNSKPNTLKARLFGRSKSSGKHPSSGKLP